MVCAGAEDPGLLGVEADVEDADVVDDLVAFKDLDWHDQSVLHEVVVDHTVEHVDAAWVRMSLPSSEHDANSG